MQNLNSVAGLGTTRVSIVMIGVEQRESILESKIYAFTSERCTDSILYWSRKTCHARIPIFMARLSVKE